MNQIKVTFQVTFKWSSVGAGLLLSESLAEQEMFTG